MGLKSGFLPELLYFLAGGLHLVLLGLFGFVHLAVFHLLKYRVLIGGAFRHVAEKQLSEIGAGGFRNVACVVLCKVLFCGEDIAEYFLLGH